MSEKSDFGLGVGTGIVSAILTFKLLTAIFVSPEAVLRKQAIERGYAEYAVDTNGKATWKWKEATSE